MELGSVTKSTKEKEAYVETKGGDWHLETVALAKDEKGRPSSPATHSKSNTDGRDKNQATKKKALQVMPIHNL